MISVLLTVKGKGIGEDIVVAVVWTAIVKHTLWRNTLPGGDDTCMHDTTTTVVMYTCNFGHACVPLWS